MFNSTSRLHRSLVVSQTVVGPSEVIVFVDGEREMVGLARTIYWTLFATQVSGFSLFFLSASLLLLVHTNLTVGSRMKMFGYNHTRVTTTYYAQSTVTP